MTVFCYWFLEKLLERIIMAGMTAKPSKYNLATDRLEFFRHMISNGSKWL